MNDNQFISGKEEKMNGGILNIIPSILCFSFVVVVFVLFYRPIKNELLPNLISFKAGGVEFSFVREFFDAALKLAEKSRQWKVEVSSDDKERALKRAQKHLQVFSQAQLLWVDDYPENNIDAIVKSNFNGKKHQYIVKYIINL